jgi:hypothetical protein
MRYLAIYNSITGDVDSYSFTNDPASVIEKEGCTTIEITQQEYEQAKSNKFGTYYDNGLIAKPAQNSKYDKWDYVNKKWVLDKDLQLWGETIDVRNQRNQLLKEMDSVISNPLRWASFSPEVQAAWMQYRLDLLNVPQQAGYPLDIVWPTIPV